MADLKDIVATLDHFEDGIRLVSTAFSVTLFTDQVLSEIPAAVLRCQELFFSMCPQGALKYYATENMRKHRPIGAKALGMLKVLLAEPGSKPDYLALELKDGERPEDAPKSFFKVISCERDSLGYREKLANAVNLSLPPEVALADPDAMMSLVSELCEAFPFQSGQAGLALHCSRYEPEPAEARAWQRSMRFPQLDIVRLPEDIHAVGQNAIKSVGWITMVGKPFSAALGSMPAIINRLGETTAALETRHGVLFKIGSTPVLTDRNRNESTGDYAKVYSLLHPWIETASRQSQWFKVGDEDRDELTRKWYHRLST